LCLNHIVRTRQEFKVCPLCFFTAMTNTRYFFGICSETSDCPQKFSGGAISSTGNLRQRDEIQQVRIADVQRHPLRHFLSGKIICVAPSALRISAWSELSALARITGTPIRFRCRVHRILASRRSPMLTTLVEIRRYQPGQSFVIAERRWQRALYVVADVVHARHVAVQGQHLAVGASALANAAPKCPIRSRRFCRRLRFIRSSPFLRVEHPGVLAAKIHNTKVNGPRAEIHCRRQPQLA